MYVWTYLSESSCPYDIYNVCMASEYKIGLTCVVRLSIKIKATKTKLTMSRERK